MSYSIVNAALGQVQNPVQLTQTIIDGLAVYNSTPDPLIELVSTPIFSTQARVPQGPLTWSREAEGVDPDRQRLDNRELLFPAGDWSVKTGWTRSGYEDAKVEDIANTVSAAMKGHAEMLVGQCMAAIFRSRPAGAIGTAYRASFANGETDLPTYGESFTTGSAHSHYAGLNTTTLTQAIIEAAVEDVLQHGWTGPYIGLFAIAQLSDLAALADAANRGYTPERARIVDQGLVDTGYRIAGVQCYVHGFVPAGYFSVMSVGEPPLRRRMHDKPEYRGLMMEQGTHSDNPLIDAKFRSRDSFSVGHLTAAVCRQLVASTTYTNPTMRFQ